MKEVIHVQQYNPTACVYACLQMVTFNMMDQREIHRQMKRWGDCTSLVSESRQLVRMGFMPDHSSLAQLIIGEIMLVTVPSLNRPRGNHRVVIDMRDNHTLYDPNEGREGAAIYDRDMQNLGGFSEVTIVRNCYEKQR